MTNIKSKEIEENVIRLRKGGADVETLLSFMRKKGFSEADSVQPLMRAVNVDLGVARDLIIDSETWADHRDSNTRLQEDASQAWIELSQDDDSDINVVVELEEPADCSQGVGYKPSKDPIVRNVITIYVRLKNQRREAWRPTKAMQVGDGLFRLLPITDCEDQDEQWEFSPGSVVGCETKVDVSGKYLRAIKP